MKILATIIIMALAAGCVPNHKTVAPAPVITPPQAEAPPPEQNPGSLFDPSRANYLFSDNRARRVGDVVLVEISETPTATQTADTTADKSSSINFGITNFLNKDSTRLTPFGPSFGLKGDVGATPFFKAGVDNEFEGTGSTSRNADVKATVAARVVKLLPGNLMQIEGAREVRVNEETQYLVVRGLIRAQDITPTNTVHSSHIADAKIEFYGKGVLADKQRPGWLSRLLENIWPF